MAAIPGDFPGVSYWLVAAPCLHSPCEQICPLSLAFSCCFHRGGMLLETLYHQHIIDTVRDGPKHSPHSPHPPAPWSLTTVCWRDRSGRYQRMDALGLLHKEWRLCVPQTKESSLTFPEEHPVCLLQPGLLARQDDLCRVTEEQAHSSRYRCRVTRSFSCTRGN